MRTVDLKPRHTNDIGAVAPVESAASGDPLAETDACWRACNSLAPGMIYLQDNPLLREPFKVTDIKARLLASALARLGRCAAASGTPPRRAPRTA